LPMVIAFAGTYKGNRDNAPRDAYSDIITNRASSTIIVS
jgi:hypothetical protein